MAPPFLHAPLHRPPVTSAAAEPVCWSSIHFRRLLRASLSLLLPYLCPYIQCAIPSAPPCHLPIPPAPLPMSPHPCPFPSAPPKPPCHHPNLPVIFPASLFPSHILVPFRRLPRSLPVISPVSLFPSYVSVHFRRLLRSLLVIFPVSLPLPMSLYISVGSSEA